MPKQDPELRKQWQHHLDQWKTSGLSAAEYCRQNNLHEQQFSYWKRALKPKPSQPFREIQVANTSSGLAIDHAGIHIQISKDFDPVTLLQVITILKSC